MCVYESKISIIFFEIVDALKKYKNVVDHDHDYLVFFCFVKERIRY